MLHKKCILYVLYLFLQLAARYSAETEAEVIEWFQVLLEVALQPGMRNMENQLRDGVLLVK